MKLRLAFLAVIGALLAAAALPGAAAAAGQPSWQLSMIPFPANFAAGHPSEYMLFATNTGAATTSGPISLEVALPPALSPKAVSTYTTQLGEAEAPLPPECSIQPGGLRCQTSEPLDPGREIVVELEVEVTSSVEGEATAIISGGGAAQAASASTRTPLSAAPPPFGFLPGFQAPAIDEDGTPATIAGAHPHQLTVDLALPTEYKGGVISSAGHPREVRFDLPPGFLGDPAATPELCTEAYFESHEECPNSTQVGVVSLLTIGIGPGPIESPLYSMVPPPGAPAELAFDAAGVGLYVHLIAGLRSDGDYGITTTSPDILALGTHPFFGARFQLWGDPSAHSHDGMRGNICVHGGSRSHPKECDIEVAPSRIPFFTLPASCPGRPSSFAVHASSWEDPETFETARYSSADAEGNPVSLSGCNQISYEPTLSARPTTDLADSPSGLDFHLHQPQEPPREEPLGGRGTAELKDARVTLPPGLVTNPSQADGLGACTEQQIGYLGEGHYSEQPQSCPDPARLGSVEVTSPLLVQRNAEQELVLDPETGVPLLETLHGAVYLAKPQENQFGSLLAIYLAIEDPRTGIVAKLAGEVEPDPQTGQLTATFSENPQLPIEDISLQLFGGARGALISPPTCGTHTTTTDLTPWSAPEGQDATPSSSFQTTGEPGGGTCPTSEGRAPNAPAFTAGTISPQAGAYSPFVLKISREDGSQRLTGIDTTLAPGLLGRLAGIAECSDAQIARAESRRNPEEGRLERESPSCPAAGEVGTVTVGAGAGPTPFYTNGHAYLAGPYKGAPLSLAVIVPAIAGPFDLGTVVTRVALHVEPETTQIHAVSDPLPTILDGIPLDVRSVALKMDRPDFTLNPTSCDPLAITGTATSALGQTAPLNQRFQVGGCPALPFRPKLALRLKGKVGRTAHPRLIADLTARPGEANVAMAQVKLPHAVFLDQGNINTVCTRVQWAADTCPAGSVYGRAEATSPLLGYPISGSVYLRSSSHKLPDLVVKLQGPASQPIEIDLDGRTDSVKGALRNTFEAVPDAPVSTFRLELFGGRRGLVEMSSGFCSARRATVKLTGQNGKAYDTTPAVAAKCPKAGKGGRHKGKAHHREGGHR